MSGSAWPVLGTFTLGVGVGALVISIGMFGWGVRASETALRQMFADPPKSLCPDPVVQVPTPALCLACPSQQQECPPLTEAELRQQCLCAQDVVLSMSEHRMAFELEMCRSSRDLAQEGWRKASEHWGSVCDQCRGPDDPQTGEATPCKGC
jgi:hypothetical protein